MQCILTNVHPPFKLLWTTGVLLRRLYWKQLWESGELTAGWSRQLSNGLNSAFIYSACDSFHFQSPWNESDLDTCPPPRPPSSTPTITQQHLCAICELSCSVTSVTQPRFCWELYTQHSWRNLEHFTPLKDFWRMRRKADDKILKIWIDLAWNVKKKTFTLCYTSCTDQFILL